MLLALDLDNTILNFHSHNALCLEPFNLKPGQATTAHALELLKIYSLEDKKPFKHGPQMLALIRESLLNGHPVAIVSYTLFPEIIQTLLEKLGLTTEELNKIYIRGGLLSAEDQSKYGKLIHIEDSLEHFGFKKTDHDQVILLDDSYQNYMLAENQGIKAVLVPDEYEPEYTDYFKEVKKILNQSRITYPYLPKYLTNSLEISMDVSLSTETDKLTNVVGPNW